MRVTVLCTGRLKEPYWRDALAEYAKRLSKYCKFEVVEVADEETPENASPAQAEQIRRREGERLLAKLPDGRGERGLICTLEIAGRRMSSEQFSAWIADAGVHGQSGIVFVIGGSLGLHESVTSRADLHLSFSEMTFPHQLARVLLAEQIYRAFRIMRGEPYHK